jgi:predicted site-specific integrase-resolvase
MDKDDPWGKYPAMMTADQVAEALQVTPKTLFLWRKNGSGPPYAQLSDTPSSSVRYPREDLRDYLAKRTVRASTQVTS